MVEVVAAIIWQDNKFLICQRPAHKPQNPLFWEFPGGKVEPNESLKQALVREIQEELAVQIKVRDVVGEEVHTYPDFTVHLTFFNCSICDGQLEKLEHNDIKWISLSEVENFMFCPGDRAMLDKLVSR